MSYVQFSEMRYITAMNRRTKKMFRLVDKIMTKMLLPANLTIEEAVDVAIHMVVAIVVSNTDEANPDERSAMVEQIGPRFIEALMELDPNSDLPQPHAWLVPPQGDITEPVCFMWSGVDEDAVQIVLGDDFESHRQLLAAPLGDTGVKVTVIEGVEGLAIADPEWDGEPPSHEEDLLYAEKLFWGAKQQQSPAPN